MSIKIKFYTRVIISLLAIFLATKTFAAEQILSAKNISLQIASTGKFYNDIFPSDAPVFKDMILQDYGNFVTFKHNSKHGKYLKIRPFAYQSYKTEWDGVGLNQYTKFTMIKQADGSIAFKSFYQGRYLQGSSGFGDTRLTANDKVLDNKAKFWIVNSPKVKNISLQIASTGKFYNGIFPSDAPEFKNIILQDYGSFVTFKNYYYSGKYLQIRPTTKAYQAEWEGVEVNQYTKFTMIKQADGSVAFKSFYQGRYLQGSSKWGGARLTANDKILDSQAKFWIVNSPKVKNISLQIASTGKFYNGIFPSDAPEFKNIILQDYGSFVTFKNYYYSGKYLQIRPTTKAYQAEWEGVEVNQYTKFTMIKQADGSVAFKSLYQGRYLQGSSKWGDTRLTANDKILDNQAKFWIVDRPKAKNISLNIASTGKFYNGIYPSNAPAFKNIILQDYGSFITFKHNSKHGKYLKIRPFAYQSYKTEWEGVGLNQYTKFTMIKQADGSVAFKSFYQGRYLQGSSGFGDTRLTANDKVLDNKAKFWIVNIPKVKNISLQVASTKKFYNDINTSDAPAYRNIILQDYGSFVTFKHHSHPGKYLKISSSQKNLAEWEGVELNQYTKFTMIKQDDGSVAFKSFYQGRYLQGSSKLRDKGEYDELLKLRGIYMGGSYEFGDTRLTAHTKILDKKAKFFIYK